MSASAYVVLLVKALRQYASIFLILILIKAFDGQRPFAEMVGIIAAWVGGYLALAAVTAFTGYYFRKYYIEDGKLVFIHGLFSKETTSIPLTGCNPYVPGRDLSIACWTCGESCLIHLRPNPQKSN